MPATMQEGGLGSHDSEVVASPAPKSKYLAPSSTRSGVEAVRDCMELRRL